MADILLNVQVKGQQSVVGAVRSISKLQSNVKLLSGAFQSNSLSQRQYYKGIAQLAEATGKSEKELRKYANELRKAERESIKAAAATKQFAQARREATEIDRRLTLERKKATAAAAEQAASEDRLRNKFVAGHQAQTIYSNELNDLAQARKLDIITTEEQTEAVQRLNLAMKNGTGAFNSYGNGLVGGTKQQSRFGVVAQQTGYQVGDFLVQIQSGANPMMALGQQATQLVGVMGLFGGKMMIAGAALGIIIPLVTAVAGYFWAVSKAAKESASKVKGLDKEIESLTETLRKWNLTKEAAAKNMSMNEFISVENVDRAKEKLEEATAELERLQRVFSTIVSGSGQLQFTELVKSLFGFGVESQVKTATDAVAEARRVLSELLKKEAEERQGLIDEEINAQETLVNALIQKGNVQAAYYGKTSTEQEKLNEELELHKELLAAGLTPSDNLYLKAVRYHAIMVSNREATAALTTSLGEAATAQASLTALGETYETQLAIINAQITALEEGKNAEVAAFIEGERIKAKAIYETSKAVAVQTGNIVAMAEASLAFLDAMSSLDALGAARAKLQTLRAPTPSSPSSPSGSGAAEKDPLAELNKRLDLDMKLLGVSESRAEVMRKLGDDADRYNRDEIDAVVQRLDVYKMETEALELIKTNQQSIADTLKNSMSDAFMSMVEGTKSFKDAMKDMARAVIKQLFDILVVQRLVGSFDSKSGQKSGIVGSIMGAFGFANGGAFQGGSQIQAFANGGVVGGPTMFPINGGKTGLMGEAGPEAIMPLKRGPDGKLGVSGSGGGGNTTLVQNIHINGNGDEYIQRKIAEAAPAMGRNAMNMMLKERKRGGSMKRTFG